MEGRVGQRARLVARHGTERAVVASGELRRTGRGVVPAQIVHTRARRGVVKCVYHLRHEQPARLLGSDGSGRFRHDAGLRAGCRRPSRGEGLPVEEEVEESSRRVECHRAVGPHARSRVVGKRARAELLVCIQGDVGLTSRRAAQLRRLEGKQTTSTNITNIAVRWRLGRSAAAMVGRRLALGLAVSSLRFKRAARLCSYYICECAWSCADLTECENSKSMSVLLLPTEARLKNTPAGYDGTLNDSEGVATLADGSRYQLHTHTQTNTHEHDNKQHA